MEERNVAWKERTKRREEKTKRNWGWLPPGHPIISTMELPNVHSHVTTRSLKDFTTLVSGGFAPIISKQYNPSLEEDESADMLTVL